MHTDGTTDNEWWMAEFREATVTRVVLYNRMDSCCAERINDAVVRLLKFLSS